jgi:hypothetical protein
MFQYEILFLLQAFRRLYEQVGLGWSFVREFCKISYNLFLQHLSYQIMLLYYVPLMFCTPMILRIRTNVNVLKNMVEFGMDVSANLICECYFYTVIS